MPYVRVQMFNSLGPGRCIYNTVYPKKYAHGFCFAVLCCGYTLTDFPISIRLTSLALWQSNDCLSASKATLMNMDKYFMWIHYERLHNHNKAKHNKTMCIFLGIYRNKSGIPEHTLWINVMSTSCKTAFRWMPHDSLDDKSTLVLVMAWCHQATSHYLNQCWPRSISPQGVAKPQWVNTGKTMPSLIWI